MSYSQTLGLIGYSLLPLVIVAPIVSLLKSYQWLSFFVKVRPHYRTGYSLLMYVNFLSRVLVCYGQHIALGLSWRRRNFDTRSLFFSTPFSYSLSISSPSTQEHSTTQSCSTSLDNFFTTSIKFYYSKFYSWSDVLCHYEFVHVRNLFYFYIMFSFVLDQVVVVCHSQIVQVS